MKKTILLFLVSLSGFAQCLSGDCQNGFGKFNFGFAIYEGNFVSGKPNGQGTMDYGGGEKFVGNFKDGQEDGAGKLYKNNIPLTVTYINGKVKYRQVVTVIGGNAPVVKGCVKGDCYNGFGIIKYDSGNSFEGIFKYGLIGESGKFIYKNGDYFEGKFVNEINTEGNYFFAQENVTYNGTFYTDGREKSGNYYYPNNKATVTILNGAITKVDNPVARRADSLAIEAKKGKPCSECSGKGMFAGVPMPQAPRDSYTISYYSDNGYGRHVERTEEIKSSLPSKTYYSLPTTCSKCKGTGKVYGGYQIIKSKGY